MGGPGVQRSTRFVQHLQEFGYEPIVLTIQEEEIKKMGSSYDESLLNYLPNNIEIVRTASGIPFNWIKTLNRFKIYRLFWFFLYPFFWERSALWPNKTYATAANLIKKHNIKIVYTSSGPFSSLVLGKKLQSKLDVKWVADMRDPFTDAYAWSYPSKLHWYICRYFEKRALNACDELIVNTQEVKKLYLSRGIQQQSKIHVITNGY